jgi:hypothetical protein
VQVADNAVGLDWLIHCLPAFSKSEIETQSGIFSIWIKITIPV